MRRDLRNRAGAGPTEGRQRRNGATGGQGAAHGSAKVGGIVRRRIDLSTVWVGCGAGTGRRSGGWSTVGVPVVTGLLGGRVRVVNGFECVAVVRRFLESVSFLCLRCRFAPDAMQRVTKCVRFGPIGLFWGDCDAEVITSSIGLRRRRRGRHMRSWSVCG